MEQRELKWEDLNVGDELRSLEYTITEELIEGFANAVDDHKEWYMKDSPFGGRIAHPTLTATDHHIMTALTWGEYAGLHAKHTAEFINPARLGKKIRVTGRIVDKYIKRERKYFELEYLAVDEDGREIVRQRFATTVEGG